MKKNVHSIKVRKRGKDGWVEGPFESERLKDIEDKITGIIDRHPNDEGSYQIVIRLNNGYSKNKEYGTTAVISLKGGLGGIWDTWNSYTVA